MKMAKGARFGNWAGEAFPMFGALAGGKYPEFVLKDKDPDRPQAFFFHHVDAGEFGEALRYLKENGYDTFDASEYMEALRHPERRRGVMLSFDDGLSTLYDTAFPLLREYGCKAVAFIIPAWTGKAGTAGWDAIRKMHESGLVDIESHSYSHTAVPVSSGILDFFDGRRQDLPPWNLPVRGSSGGPADPGAYRLGDPLFVHASRLSDTRRFYPDERIAAFCREWASEAKWDSRGVRAPAKKKLGKEALRYMREYGLSGRAETEEQQRLAIQTELGRSKKEIEARLHGKTVRFLSYPWNQAGRIAESLIAGCGYTGAFGGMKVWDAKGTSLPRLSGDFIMRLPGKGRKPFSSILLRKMKRRLTRGPAYALRS